LTFGCPVGRSWAQLSGFIIALDNPQAGFFFGKKKGKGRRGKLCPPPQGMISGYVLEGWLVPHPFQVYCTGFGSSSVLMFEWLRLLVLCPTSKKLSFSKKSLALFNEGEIFYSSNLTYIKTLFFLKSLDNKL